jgi:putative tricarboxylic transport membrane protein
MQSPAAAGAAWMLMCLMLSFVAGPSAHAQNSPWKPEKTVELVVGSTPGGGTDITARTLQKIFQDQKLLDAVIVVNKPGGSQTVAWAYLNQGPGDGHRVSITNEPLIANKIMGISKLSHDDFIPLGLLFNEYVVFIVKPDSSLQSGTDLVRELKKDIGALSFGQGSSRGNNAHIAISLLGKAVGGDIKRQKMIVLKSGGETMVSLMGGHIDVGVSTIAAAVQHLKADRVRPLAVTSAKRLGGNLSDVPTWKEHNVPLVYGSWRVVFAPRGLTNAQIAYWQDLLQKAVATLEWRKALEQNEQDYAYLSAHETRKFLDAEAVRLKPLFGEIGLGNQ